MKKGSTNYLCTGQLIMDYKRISSEKWEVTSSVADGTIAIFISILLFIIQLKILKNIVVSLTGKLQKLPWGVLILFGGGLALAKGISESGLAKWLGEQLKSLNGVSPILIVIVITIFVLFLTEVTSNTATATMILPILQRCLLLLECIHYYLWHLQLWRLTVHTCYQ